MEFTYEQIEAIFTRWYAGEKVVALIKTFKIDKEAGLGFAKHFPPLLCDDTCPHCLENLYAYRADPAYFKRHKTRYDFSTAHCLNCGHVCQKSNCKCLGCEKERHEKAKLAAEAEENRLVLRTAHLDSLYDNIIPANFDEMELSELIYLYALCYQSSCEDLSLISPLSTSENPFSPSEDWDRECIQSLLKYIAPLCDDENLLKIDENGSASWNGHKVFYRIKIASIDEVDYLESLLIYIKNKMKENSICENFELVSLYEKLMIYECIDYLKYMRSTIDFPHEAGVKTTALFKKLIQNWRIDQIYNILWGRCKDALAFKVQNGLPKPKASNLIISLVDKHVDRVIQNNWEIKSYYRDSSNKQSTLSYVLFNKILEMGGAGVEYNFQDVLTKLKGLSKSEQLETTDFCLGD